jgi:hypothetical protein
MIYVIKTKYTGIMYLICIFLSIVQIIKQESIYINPGNPNTASVMRLT